MSDKPEIEVLSYIGPSRQNLRFSRLAGVSLAVAIFGIPYALWLVFSMFQRGYEGAIVPVFLLGMIATSITLPIMAIIRIKDASQRLRGLGLAYAGLTVSLCWLGLLAYFLRAMVLHEC